MPRAALSRRRRPVLFSTPDRSRTSWSDPPPDPYRGSRDPQPDAPRASPRPPPHGIRRPRWGRRGAGRPVRVGPRRARDGTGRPRGRRRGRRTAPRRLRRPEPLAPGAGRCPPGCHRRRAAPPGRTGLARLAGAPGSGDDVASAGLPRARGAGPARGLGRPPRVLLGRRPRARDRAPVVADQPGDGGSLRWGAPGCRPHLGADGGRLRLSRHRPTAGPWARRARPRDPAPDARRDPGGAALAARHRPRADPRGRHRRGRRRAPPDRARPARRRAAAAGIAGHEPGHGPDRSGRPTPAGAARASRPTTRPSWP